MCHSISRLVLHCLVATLLGGCGFTRALGLLVLGATAVLIIKLFCFSVGVAMMVSLRLLFFYWPWIIK